MNSVYSAIIERAKQLTNAIRNPEMTEEATRLALEEAFRGIVDELAPRALEELAAVRDELAVAIRERNDSRSLALQMQRESEASIRAVERAIAELVERRSAMVRELAPVSLATASNVIACDGSGEYFAHVVEGRSLVRRMAKCPGCPRCKPAIAEARRHG